MATGWGWGGMGLGGGVGIHKIHIFKKAGDSVLIEEI